MIDEKKLIETIVNTPSEHQDDCCLEFLEGMATRQHEILDIIKEQPKTDWIPCEERLPSEATTYLVTEEVIVCSQKQYVVDIRLFGTENQWLCPTNRKIIA